jgi:uncharacterized membrane protein YeaQ/YmgE (transglycosylase-associated protein family)
MLWFIISIIVIGFLAGLLARALVPGNDSMGLLATTVLGIIGSLIGGFLGYVLFGSDRSSGAFQTSGLIGSIIGAIIALLVYRMVGRRERV